MTMLKMTLYHVKDVQFIELQDEIDFERERERDRRE